MGAVAEKAVAEPEYAHARRALKEYRALHLERDAVRAVAVARKICRNGIFDLLFRRFDIHRCLPFASARPVHREE